MSEEPIRVYALISFSYNSHTQRARFGVEMKLLIIIKFIVGVVVRHVIMKWRFKRVLHLICKLHSYYTANIFFSYAQPKKGKTEILNNFWLILHLNVHSQLST